MPLIESIDCNGTNFWRWLRRADRAFDGVALAQAVLLDLAHRDIHVVGAGQVAGCADERVRIEHVDDAGHGHQVRGLLLALVVVAVLVTAVVVALVALVALVVRAVAAAVRRLGARV
jgi:hypothetical protein